MTWLLTIGAKLKLWALAAGAAVVALGAFYLKARQDGKNAVEAEQAKARAKLQERYDEIDAGPVDPAGSYDRLRRMSDDRR